MKHAAINQACEDCMEFHGVQRDLAIRMLPGFGDTAERTNMARAESQPQPSIPPVALFLLVIAALYFARDILIPLAIAVLLAFLLTPAVRRLESWRSVNS